MLQPAEMTDIEWRRLEWLQNFEISEFGDLRKLDPFLLVRGWIQDGYRMYAFRLNGKKLTTPTHRLCCEAFWGPPPEKMSLCAHWDDDRSNNHYSNLRWTDRKGNADDAMRNGAYDRTKKRIIQPCKIPDIRYHNGRSKLSWDQVDIIRSNGGTSSKIASEYGISRQIARKVLTGRAWKTPQ